MFRKLLKFILFGLIFLLIVIAVIAVRFHSKQIGEIKNQPNVYPIDTIAIRNLSDAIKIKTISIDNMPADTAAFDSLIHFLVLRYPDVFNKLESEVINQSSLLLHWKGKDTGMKPVIFYAHLDVVPVDTNWSFDPFEGKVDKDFIYGRGAVDDKGAVIAIFESIHRSLAKSFIPKRDLYFAFGHDEEKSGQQGAKKIAAILKAKNIQAEFLLDEGGIIAEGMVPFVSQPVALIATAEKGYVTFELTVKGDGGHSSMPPNDPPAEILAAAIQSIHDHPFETRMTQPLSDFIDYVGPEMKYPFKALFANRWLFQEVIFNEYKKIPGAYSMIHTTAVTTMLSGGIKENVIPSEVKATINLRILQGEDSYSVKERLVQIINVNRVSIRQVGNVNEPSRISSTKAQGFLLLQDVIRSVFPDVIISPNLSTGGTDSKHFTSVTESVYRFLPTRMNSELLEGMHGKNEKLRVSNFMEMIEFYEQVLVRL